MPEPGNAYLAVKLAAQLFGKPLESLEPDELRRVNRVATRQREIEGLILATPEAAAVMLPEASIDAHLKEIRDRYDSDDEQLADLETVGLDARSLRHAVARDMLVEAVLERSRRMRRPSATPTSRFSGTCTGIAFAAPKRVCYATFWSPSTSNWRTTSVSPPGTG
ncbi:MAG: hypothetical protein IPK02_11155 [Candidatus Accumulibacter sp.]|uniref:Uncharacterized protein n=1 Tax=Candidatus Accumulibacter affinis TaxID=2954384 RepID=A0A935W512_9PROT|nr:hypothetical protein [Candidatus Accumulibacter affinis]